MNLGRELDPSSHRGCLWGVVGGLIAALVILCAVVGYGAWYFHKGFDRDPRVKVIVAAVAHDGRAAQILGQHITVMQLEHYTYGYASDKGGTATYVLKVTGDHGAGEIQAELDVAGTAPAIRRLSLSDEDGHRYFLIGGAAPTPIQQNSI